MAKKSKSEAVPMPVSNVFADYVIWIKENPKEENYKKFVDRICKYNRAPLSVTEAELDELIVFLSNCSFKVPVTCLKKNGKKTTENAFWYSNKNTAFTHVFDSSAAIEHLHKMMPRFANVASTNAIGTHITKIPNANATIAHHPTLMSNKNSSATGSHFATSYSVKCARRFSGLSLVSEFSVLRILTTPFECDGIVRSVAEDLIARGPFFQAMLKMISPSDREILDLVIADLSKRLLAEPIDFPYSGDAAGTLKLLYHPVGETYHLISPVTAVAYAGEFHTRVFNRIFSGKQSFNKRYMHVGGDNVINTGSLSSDLAGDFVHLVCVPPPEIEFRKSNIRKLMKKYDYICSSLSANKANHDKLDKIASDIIAEVIQNQFVDPQFKEPIEPTPETVLEAVKRAVPNIMTDAMVRRFEYVIADMI